LIICSLLFISFSGCEYKKNQETQIFDIGLLNLEFDAYAKLQHQNKDFIVINERNLIKIQCDSTGQCFYKNKLISLKDLQLLLYKTLTNQLDSINYPKLKTQSFKFSGTVTYPEMLFVNVNYDSTLSYKTYTNIRTTILNTYIKVRDDFSQNKFQKSIYQLIHSKDPTDIEKWHEIKQIYPIHYLEN
jgi:hypothetical protein